MDWDAQEGNRKGKKTNLLHLPKPQITSTVPPISHRNTSAWDFTPAHSTNRLLHDSTGMGFLRGNSEGGWMDAFGIHDTAIHSPPMKRFQKKTAVAYGADLLAFELNGEVVSGLPGHHSSENLVLSWARRVAGDDCLEIHVLLMFF